jgi:hypothetical protein
LQDKAIRQAAVSYWQRLQAISRAARYDDQAFFGSLAHEGQRLTRRVEHLKTAATQGGR